MNSIQLVITNKGQKTITDIHLGTDVIINHSYDSSFHKNSIFFKKKKKKSEFREIC